MAMFKNQVAALTLGVLAATGGTGAIANEWEFQFVGLDFVYDHDQVFTNLGTSNPISGTFPVVRDQNPNGDQSFGTFAEGDPLDMVLVRYNGVAYGTLSNDIAVDFRLVLRTSNDAVDNSDQDPINWTAGVGMARIDTERSFFDLFTDTEAGSAWGIALDTDTSSEQDIFYSNTPAGASVSGFLSGQLFSDPGSLDIPDLTDEGDPLAALIAADDSVIFSFSGNNNQAFANCPPDINDCDVSLSGTGEVTLIPEPSMLSLLGLGLLGAGFGYRRRRSTR